MQIQAANEPAVKPNILSSANSTSSNNVQTFEQLILDEITQLIQTDSGSSSMQNSGGPSFSDILQNLFPGAFPSLETVSGANLIDLNGVQQLTSEVGNVSDMASVSSENATSTMKESPIDNMIAQASGVYGVPSNLIKAVMQQESGMNVHAVSGAGAMGLMQLMPGTAQAMGVSNPFDAEQNVMGGTKYLSQLLTQFGGNQALALAAYNAGPAAVEKYGGIPPFTETQNYVNKVLNYATAFA